MRHANAELHKQKNALVCTSIESNPYIHPYILVFEFALSLCITSASPSSISSPQCKAPDRGFPHRWSWISLSEMNSLTTRIAPPHLTLNNSATAHSCKCLQDYWVQFSSSVSLHQWDLKLPLKYCTVGRTQNSFQHSVHHSIESNTWSGCLFSICISTALTDFPSSVFYQNEGPYICISFCYIWQYISNTCDPVSWKVTSMQVSRRHFMELPNDR